MSWNEAIGSVKEQLPRFNDYLLEDYRREQVDRFDEFIHTVFQEAIQLFNGDLKYHGYRVLSPEKRIAYNIENGLIKGRVNIQKSELKLLEFMFEYEDQMVPVYLYLPYLHNNALIINDTKFYIRLAIIDRMIFRVTNGVIVKVMRSPLQFWRTEQFTYTDTEGVTAAPPPDDEPLLLSQLPNANAKNGTSSQNNSFLVFMILMFYCYLFSGTHCSN